MADYSKKLKMWKDMERLKRIRGVKLYAQRLLRAVCWLEDRACRRLEIPLAVLCVCAVNGFAAISLSALPQPLASLAPSVNPNLGSLSLAWTRSPSSNITSYAVQYGTNRTALNNSAGVGNVTNATVTGLFPANTYYITVTARNADGMDSDPSNMVTNFIQPRMVMLPDRWKVWLSLPAGRTNVIQSSTNATFASGVRNILTNISGGVVWFYETNNNDMNFFRLKP